MTLYNKNWKAWIPEGEMELMKQLQKEIDDNMFSLLVWGKTLDGRTSHQIHEEYLDGFVFVNCKSPYGICMERRRDKKIYEMKEMGEPDLNKPVNRKYFERYSRGMDL